VGPDDAGVHAERTLTTEHFVLEPIVQGHADELFAGLSAAALYSFIPGDPPASVEELRAQFRRWQARRSASGDEVWLNYAVREQASGHVCGTLQSTIVSVGFAYLAYFVFAEHWRRGVASEACRELVRVLFVTFGVDRVVAHVDTRNEASIRLLKTLRFQLVDTIPGADTFKGGVSDEFVFALTRPDWELSTRPG
jgi:ribosomal-protein-alanine N-acetyltransferase